MTLHKRLPATALLAPVGGLAHAADGVSTGPLPRNVVASLVHLQLKLDQKRARFSGVARIKTTVAEAVDTIWVHGRDLEIGKAEAVLVDGRRVALTATDADVSGVLKLAAASTIPAGEATIEITYHAPFGQLQGA